MSEPAEMLAAIKANTAALLKMTAGLNATVAPILDAKDAAAYLDVSVKTLRRWVADGDIKPAMFGKRPKFAREWLDDYIEKRRVIDIDLAPDSDAIINRLSKGM